MGQTAEDIRDNIVKIADENGNCVGTGFFIHKEYCVTCHHNICRLDEIYVEREEDPEKGQRKRRYHAEWSEEFSDIQKDVAFLKVKDADFRPLKYRKETYGNIPVGVRGFPLLNIYEFPQGRDERGTLTDILEQFRWKEDKAIGEFENSKKKWNVKPEVNVDVYAFSGKFYEGFSGAPVYYRNDGKVVGMFEAKDDNQGFIIPMNVVINKFDLEKEKKISTPSPISDTENDSTETPEIESEVSPEIARPLPEEEEKKKKVKKKKWRIIIILATSAAAVVGLLFGLGIIPPNNGPIANAGEDQIVNASCPVTLDGSSSSDPDSYDKITSYRWNQVSGPLAAFDVKEYPGINVENRDEVISGFKSPNVTSDTKLRFYLTVKDTRDQSDTDFVDITVKPVNSSSVLECLQYSAFAERLGEKS